MAFHYIFQSLKKQNHPGTYRTVFYFPSCIFHNLHLSNSLSLSIDISIRQSWISWSIWHICRYKDPTFSNSPGLTHIFHFDPKIDCQSISPTLVIGHICRPVKSIRYYRRGKHPFCSNFYTGSQDPLAYMCLLISSSFSSISSTPDWTRWHSDFSTDWSNCRSNRFHPQ